MKNIVLSTVAVLAMSSFAVAGGDITPVEEPAVVEQVVSTGDFYVGAAYSYMDFNADPISNPYEADIAGHAFTLLAGYNVNKYFAVEGRYSLAMSSLAFTDIDGDDFDYSGDMSNIAVYLKPMYPIGGLTVYGLLGYGKVSIDLPDPDAPEQSESGFQWGLGASYAVNNNIGIFIDYTRLYDDTNFDEMPSDNNIDFLVDSINFGVTYTF